MTQPKIQNPKPQPPSLNHPYEIPDFLDILHASGWRIVPDSLRWEGPKGEEKPVVDIEEIGESLRRKIKMYYDSTNQPIKVGDKVRFRGREYTIKRFLPSADSLGTAGIEFNEPQHTPELATETSVDLIQVAPDSPASYPAV